MRIKVEIRIQPEARRVQPLTLDLIVPPEEFLARKAEFLADHMRYVERYRKARLGPRVTLIFENRQTLWFRVQDLIATARITDPRAQERELQFHNRLLPSAGGLQAALLLDTPASSSADPETWTSLRGEGISMHLGPHRVLRANMLSADPADRCWGTAHWIQFLPDTTHLELLADPDIQVWCAIQSGTYSQAGNPLSADMRRSLIEDIATNDAHKHQSR